MDIEGTTTPIAFVHDVLFPYARANLPALLRDQAHDPCVAAAMAAIPGDDKLGTLLAWMDRDEKATPLKILQGIVWDTGYAAGTLQGVLYPDVAPALYRWHGAGRTLAIYSSGSIAAQRLIFAHSTAGDLTPLLTAYFDTTTGPKRDPASYTAIAASLGLVPGQVLFLSDVGAELDAAATAGLQTCQLVRPADGTMPVQNHPIAHDFDTVGQTLGL
jgi:enolase-phosphatase E1